MSFFVGAGATPGMRDMDISWVRRTFILPSDRPSRQAVKKARTPGTWLMENFQFFGVTGVNFTDTGFGGNYAINTPAQVHPGIDVRLPDLTTMKEFKGGTYTDPMGSLTRLKAIKRGGASQGMGRLYRDTIDKNSHLIHIRCGKPHFTPSTTFFTGFYNHDAAYMARTGKAKSIFSDLIGLMGTIATLPLTMIIGAGAFYRWAGRTPASQFYTLKPTMPLFWSQAQQILNAINTYKGIYTPRVSDSIVAISGVTDKETADLVNPEHWSKIDSNTFGPDGAVNLLNIANRPAALRKAFEERFLTKLNGGDEKGIGSMAAMKVAMSQLILDDMFPEAKTSSLEKILAEYWKSKEGLASNDLLKDTDHMRSTAVVAPTSDGRILGKQETWVAGATNPTSTDTDMGEVGWLEEFWQRWDAEMSDGSAFVTFRVEHGGTANFSTNNTTRQSDIASSFNASSSSARNKVFDLSGGNISADGIGGIINSVAASALSGIGTFISGMGASGLFALGGSAFVDIPEMYDNSSSSPASLSYNIPLRTWSNNPITVMKHIDIPLACLLALALPHSAGKASYTTPFLMEIYHKGWGQSRLAIVESLAINYGTGNIGYTEDKNILGVDVNITFKPLSSIIHAAITNNISINPFNSLFNDESNFTDLLATLSSISMNDQFYIKSRLTNSFTRWRLELAKLTSPAYWAAHMNASWTPGRIVNLIAVEDVRP